MTPIELASVLDEQRKRCAARWPDFIFAREQDPKFGWVVRATASVGKRPLGIVVVVADPWLECAWLEAERFVLNGMISVMEALDALN